MSDFAKQYFFVFISFSKNSRLISYLCECETTYLIACSPTNHVHSFQFPAKIFRPIAKVVRRMLNHWRSSPSDKPLYFRPTERCSCHGTDEIVIWLRPMDQPLYRRSMLVPLIFVCIVFACDCYSVEWMSPIAYMYMLISLFSTENQSDWSVKKQTKAHQHTMLRFKIAFSVLRRELFWYFVACNFNSIVESRSPRNRLETKQAKRRKTILIFTQFFAMRLFWCFLLLNSIHCVSSVCICVCTVHSPLHWSQRKMPILTFGKRKKKQNVSDGNATKRRTRQFENPSVIAWPRSIPNSMCVIVVMLCAWITWSILFRHYFYLISFSFGHDTLL